MSTAAKAAKPAQAVQTKNPPNQTLYVQNLNDRINKGDLRRALYALFSTYGHVLDVVALKTAKARGQAFIVFRDSQTSEQAMRALQGFEMFGKEMRIGFGKGKSNIISRLDGTAKVPERPQADGPAVTETQKSIFGIPPGQTAQANTLKAPNGVLADGGRSPQGVKRPLEDDSDDDIEMDEGEEMDESED